MKRSDIRDMWQEDMEIGLDLQEESRRTPRLHAKYSYMLDQENIRLAAIRRDYKNLRGRAWALMKNPPREPKDNPEGFLSHLSKKVFIDKTKAFADDAMDGDPVLNAKELEIELQEAKVKYLESILWQIRDRKDHIRNIQNNLRFNAGD